METLTKSLNTEIILTDEQQHAIDAIVLWLEQPQITHPEFKLGGFAGTGKTTIIKFLIKLLADKYNIAVIAFTGKAVNVLNRKGVQAQTMHSCMYDVEQLPGGQLAFYKKTRLESDPDLIIVDEASMVSTELYNDLVSFKKKYLFVGDPGQLEPVGDNPQLMFSPDLVLQTIHRQAESSPIIKLANWVRKGGAILGGNANEDLIISNKNVPINVAAEHDQVICAKNHTRIGLNKHIRSFKNLIENKLTLGEKIIVLQNNIAFGVFNGMILFVQEIVREEQNCYVCKCVDEIDRNFNELPIWKLPFEQPDALKKDTTIPKFVSKTYSKAKPKLVFATYGYAITCHKSQGSEWNSVLVWDEWMPPSVWDMKRWRYTAITRAAKKLTYCL